MEETKPIDRLIAIMAALRDPVTGCPWDVEQDFRSIARYTIEEAYEVTDAIDRGDMVDLCDELGDLLLQVVFHARMAEEQGLFTFDDVTNAIANKMVRRHPHVFGTSDAQSVVEVQANWDRIKADEKRERRQRRQAAGLMDDHEDGVLSGIPKGLAPLQRALKLQEKASTVGFDWNDPRQVLDKITEECAEVVDAQQKGADTTALHDEIGDVLFAVVNLARHFGVNPETALTATNTKFVRRFAAIEAALKPQGQGPGDVSLETLERLWQEAKEQEAGQG